MTGGCGDCLCRLAGVLGATRRGRGCCRGETCESLPLLLVCEALLDPDEVAPAGKTVVRVKVSVSSWSLGSSSKSVEVVV